MLFLGDLAQAMPQGKECRDGQVSGYPDGEGTGELEQLVSVGKAAARKLTHARILLLADDWHGEAHAEDEIVAALGTSLRTVDRVRKRFVTEGSRPPWTTGPSRPGPTRSRSRGTSSSS